MNMQIELKNGYFQTNQLIEKNPIEKILEDLGGQVKTRIIKNELGSAFPYYKQMNEIVNMEKIQMRMPNQFEIY